MTVPEETFTVRLCKLICDEQVQFNFVFNSIQLQFKSVYCSHNRVIPSADIYTTQKRYYHTKAIQMTIFWSFSLFICSSENVRLCPCCSCTFRVFCIDHFWIVSNLMLLQSLADSSIMYIFTYLYTVKRLYLNLTNQTMNKHEHVIVRACVSIRDG